MRQLRFTCAIKHCPAYGRVPSTAPRNTRQRVSVSWTDDGKHRLVTYTAHVPSCASISVRLTNAGINEYLHSPILFTGKLWNHTPDFTRPASYDLNSCKEGSYTTSPSELN